MSKTCCVTGHRDLPAGRLPEITAALSAEIDRAIAEGFDSFFSGFAEGVDLLFAKLVVQKSGDHPGLRLLAAIPFRQRFERLASDPETAALLDACAEVHVVSETYHDSVYRDRNRFMVDRSQLVIAVYDGRAGGGTTRTLAYARKTGRKARVLFLK